MRYDLDMAYVAPIPGPAPDPSHAADAVLAALADPSRRRIVALLAAGRRAVHEIQSHFDFSQPALSRHLRILREAGIVDFERAGRVHHYGLRGEALRGAADWLLHLHAFWNDRLDGLGAILDEGLDENAGQEDAP